MRAAYYEQNGPAREVLALGEVDTPNPGPGEVRVRLRTSGVNPSDVKSRVGLIMKLRYPRVIPHSDGAGVIDAVGEGVSAARIGERVWVWNAQWMRPCGTAAQYVVLPAQQAVALPDRVAEEAAACLGIPALTAIHAVSVAGPVDGKTVFVSGGAGAVSHYAIQIAKRRGAKVITTVSNARKAELAAAAGADVVIDYRREDVAAAVRANTDGAGADAVLELDLAANAALLPGILAPRGTVVVYGSSAPTATIPAFFTVLSSIRYHGFLVYTLDERERATAIAGLGQLLEQGALIHNVAARFPLSDIVAAHEAVESGQVAGNVVIDID